jgi:hypothetical protein
MRVAFYAVWQVQCINEKVLGERYVKHMYGQDRGWLVGSAPPNSWTTGDTDGAENGGLDGVEAAWSVAVFG